MNKIYPIIHLNNEMYMVDKEANVNNIKEGDWFIRKNQLFQSIGRPDNKDFAGYYNPDFCYIDYDCYKILASSDKSLNFPLLPAVEDDIESLALKVIPIKEYGQIGSGSDSNIPFRKVWKEGYKAASAKKYTEKDIEAAVAFGMSLDRFRSTRKEEISDTEEFNGFLDSLKPKPISAEVEIVTLSQWIADDTKHGRVLYEIPKVDENNIIVVKRWIYE